jgi:hypothetical protein
MATSEEVSGRGTGRHRQPKKRIRWKIFAGLAASGAARRRFSIVKVGWTGACGKASCHGRMVQAATLRSAQAAPRGTDPNGVSELYLFTVLK